MANDSTNSRTSNQNKAPSRGATPKTPQTPGSRPPPLQTSQAPPPKVQHVPSQPPTTSAWASAARTATNVRTAPVAKGSNVTSTGPGLAGGNGSGQVTPTGVAGNGVLSEHRPVNGYNAKEIKQFMRQGREDQPSHELKTEGSTTAGKRTSGGAWGAQPTHMANGQDFWVQLSKQIAQLEQQGRGG